MIRFFAILVFSGALSAQIVQAPHGPQGPEGLDEDLTDPHPHSDIFHRGNYDLLVPTLSPGGLEWPDPHAEHAFTGTVSLHELQHPIPKKALQAAYKAQQYAQANKTAKAIEELEKAVRIDPSYRDGHCNLGVQYARAQRLADARTEFRKALDIGPPAAPIYTNLALTYIVSGELQQAASIAQKALELDPENALAKRILAAGHP